jgi:PEP-CTERM motif
MTGPTLSKEFFKMSTSIRRFGTLALVVMALASFSAFGAPIWVNWTSLTSTSATGVLTDGSGITVTLTGAAANSVQPVGNSTQQGSTIDNSGISSGYGYTLWAAGGYLPQAYPAGIFPDGIALAKDTTYTVTFSGGSISGLDVAFESLGTCCSAITAAYTFNNGLPITVSSTGNGPFGGSGPLTVSGGNVVNGAEANGVVHQAGFGGSSFTFTTVNNTDGAVLQIGVDASAVPEPGTLALFAGGIALIAGSRLRRRS